MTKHDILITYTFINPNTPQSFESQLRKVLIDKLLTLYRQNTMARK